MKYKNQYFEIIGRDQNYFSFKGCSRVFASVIDAYEFRNQSPQLKLF